MTLSDAPLGGRSPAPATRPRALAGEQFEASLLLGIVERLVAELHPGDAVAVSLDSRFDRDLGLDSLGLVELWDRVEAAFDVVLPDDLFATAETPRDLLVVLAVPPPPVAVIEERVGLPVPGEQTGAPGQARTLLEALEWHVQAHPDRVHVRLLDDPHRPGELTYAGLHRAAAEVAAGLAGRKLERGQAVGIMLPTSRDYFAVFVGVLLAGGIPVPIYPPMRRSQLEDHLRRQARILDNAGAAILVTVPEARLPARLLRPLAGNLRAVVTPAELAVPGGSFPGSRAAGSDVALLQYTSGSTANPKGVVLTHAAVLANLRAMGQAARATPDDVFVSWLPLYHDMGLIGAWLGSLYHGFPLVIMPSLAFLTRPARWLQAISRHRGTLSAAPNFGYELCLRKIDEAELDGVDLSSWRLAFNGAEPVSPDTLAHFATRFAPYGFRPEALTPVYGLAEASVGLAFPPLGRGPVIDRVAREPFTRTGRALSATPDEAHPLRFVACGQPVPGHEIRVVDPAGRELGERHEGRVEFRGPSATTGYRNDPEATRRLLHGEWLDTGDLGYVAGADLYITGRVKDLIIRAGRNLHPEELEDAIGAIPGVRTGCAAAFAAPDPAAGTERLVIVAETRRTEDEARATLRHDIMARVTDVAGTPPDEVLLTPPGTVPKTSSGKIRRAAARDLYQRGTLGASPRGTGWQVARLTLAGIVPRLRRLRQSTATTLYAAYAWVLLLVVGIPTLLAVATLPRRSWRWAATRAGAGLLIWLSGTPLVVNGTRRLPAGRATVVVANHQSFLDGLVLTAALPTPVRFVAAREFATRPIVGAFLRRLGTEFVERTDRAQGVADVDRLTGEVRDGDTLVFFPEGRLSRAPGLRAFHMGAFVVAATAAVPVVPVAIRGSRSVLRPDRYFVRHASVHVEITDPIEADGGDFDAAVHLRSAARSALLPHCGEPDLT